MEVQYHLKEQNRTTAGMPAPLLLYLWANSVSAGLRKDAWLNCKETGRHLKPWTDSCVVQVYSIHTHKARQ